MNRFEKQELKEHFELLNKIDKILDLAGFNIFPAGADKYRRRAKQAILDLIEDEVIGKDEPRPDGNGSSSRVRRVVSQNELRSDQRKKLRGKS